MGHKVNATSFRIKKNWDSSYFLNNSLKLKNYIFKSLNNNEIPFFFFKFTGKCIKTFFFDFFLYETLSIWIWTKILDRPF